jgi:hypothetical protein
VPLPLLLVCLSLVLRVSVSSLFLSPLLQCHGTVPVCPCPSLWPLVCFVRSFFLSMQHTGSKYSCSRKRLRPQASSQETAAKRRATAFAGTSSAARMLSVPSFAPCFRIRSRVRSPLLVLPLLGPSSGDANEGETRRGRS